jgi:peptidoglycan/xylan/chitin deacetylase (PgdA/CDA1 family)
MTAIAGAERDRVSLLDTEDLLRERYQDREGRSPLLPIYYGIKPLLPRGLQLAARRFYAARQAARSFPAWPIEPILIEREHRTLLARMREQGEQRTPIVNFWPGRQRFASILTHDVEGSGGVDRIEAVREIERRHGFVSSWNFVAEWYPIPDGTFQRLREEGCEIGLHGITHDGKLFQSRSRFESELPAIHSYLREWGAVGFRSPATHRHAEWMPELGCLYDSSYPDSDPFEPQSGGCCSIFPFQLGELVELPITLIQDHTLWEILRDETIDRWVEKSRWIIENHGLVNLITHPDYLDSPARLEAYDAFLAFLASRQSGWHALPREVAQWWRDRAALEPAGDGAAVTLTGPEPARSRASVAWATAAGDRIAYEL